MLVILQSIYITWDLFKKLVSVSFELYGAIYSVYGFVNFGLVVEPILVKLLLSSYPGVCAAS